METEYHDFTVVIPTQPPPSRRVAIWLIIEFNLLHWIRDESWAPGRSRAMVSSLIFIR